MLLSLTHHHNHRYPPPQPPKTPPSTTLCSPKTLTFQNLKSNPPKPLIRCSSETLPHSAIQRIADKLRSLGFTEQNPNPNPNQSPDPNSGNAGEIFIPLAGQLAKYRVGHTLDRSWSTPENPVPRPGSGAAISRFYELRDKAKMEKEEAKRRRKELGRVPSLAELSLSKAELRRLRSAGIAEKRKLKVGKAGITEGVVNGIHERWRRAEVVKIVCEDLCRMNMKRTHDLLERKTGGLVVWRSGSKIVLYRGANYKYPYFISDTASSNETSPDISSSINMDKGLADEMESCSSDTLSSEPSLSPIMKLGEPSLVHGVGSPNRVRFQLPGEAQLAEEADHLLDGLGPRFTDWWGYEPLPVDADLLPAVVSGYRQPFRLLPYGVKPKLTDDEMTTLKRLSRPLPCHFALGRNRKLQGLAASIVKLWEKCEIAKVAVKRGVQNTNSEMMAEELKSLTGGTLLARDREFIVLYRGKDFLPSVVSSVVEERRRYGMQVDKPRDNSRSGESPGQLKDGFLDCGSVEELDSTKEQSCNLSKQWKLRPMEAAMKRTSVKLSMALEKKARAEKLLAELEKTETPHQPEIDKEGITEEEQYMLRKVGLKMKPFLLMGRRGVFDGTIENMHLHWKYRELVKIICKEQSSEAVHRVAHTLEAESGGILVAVERVSKGYAIILYRGKNYRRPSCLRPPTLLSKKEALKRSLEEQRRKSLKLHVLKLTRNVDNLQLKLVKDKKAHNVQSSDQLNYQVKEGMHEQETVTLLGSNSELNSFDQNATDQLEADSRFNTSDDSLNPSNEPPLGQVNQTIVSPIFVGDKTVEIKSLSKSDIKETWKTLSQRNRMTEGIQSEEKGFSECVKAEDWASDKEVPMSSVRSNKTEPRDSLSTAVNEEAEKASKVVHLSNRDRLLLRKQALKMKKRPVLAVGRSNIVTGVAKAIKAHFKRHPLAIVNVKGRAKGTSVQEVVFKLEQETGAVLISQEPSKVILYRGWGANDEPSHKGKKNAQDGGTLSTSREPWVQNTVSPDLMAAIRLECRLQHNQEEKPGQSAVI